MAEALVSIVLNQLCSISVPQLQQQDEELNLGVCEEDLRKLTQTLTALQPLLQDAEEKQFKDEAVKLWLQEVKDVAYDADDVFDELLTRIRTASKTNRRGESAPIVDKKKEKKVCCSNLLVSCFKPPPPPPPPVVAVVVHANIGEKIKEIRERVDRISLEKDTLNLVQVRSGLEEYEELPEASSYFVTEICGREYDKEKVLSMLLMESDRSERRMPVSVISIVGMGGIGKTTLAQLIFNSWEVQEAFEERIWVCVSDPFNMIDIAKKIIESVGGIVPNVSGWEDLDNCLCHCIKKKRFLLVLDDVWTGYPQDWDPLMLSLNFGAPGSKILVTSRFEEVALMMGSVYRLRLGFLSDDDSWQLFRRITFGVGRCEECEKFMHMGMEIVRRCRGHILAVRMLASLMRFKKTEQEWRIVLESDIWDLQEEMNVVLPVILLSYFDLPPHLKQCFAYCAIFLQDEEIIKDTLVKFWMGQGFIGTDRRREPEVIGGKYFDNLAMRSFFQDFNTDSNGNVVSCKMHDILHDFAQNLSVKECCIMETDDTVFKSTKVRHLTICNTKEFPIYNARNLRTVRLNKTGLDLTVSIDLFHQYPYLRVLDLAGSCLEEFPSEVEMLTHLRYLDLSRTNLSVLPETMRNLHNLQCLKLNWCSYLHALPEGIGEMSNLRHLEIERTNRLCYLPQGIGKLSCLQTLSKFIVADPGEGCNIGELKHLNYLHGSLEILGLGQVANVHEAVQAELNKKEYIHVLKFDFGNMGEGNEEKIEGVLERLKPHANLEKLDIIDYQGSRFPLWMSRNLPLCSLLSLELSQFKKCTELPDLGNLESLETLVIDGMEAVKYIGHEFCGLGNTPFPKLKKLKFSRMMEWEEWDLPMLHDEIMPHLCDLMLYSCPKLKSLPALGKLKSLESLCIKKLYSVKHVGCEFLGIAEAVATDADDGSGKTVGGRESTKDLDIFPRLVKLSFSDMKEWEEWDLPFQKDKIIMPGLSNLTLWSCPKLRALPSIGRLKSLQCLKLISLERVQCSGLEFLGPFDDDGSGETGESASMTVVPKLTYIDFNGLGHWEEQDPQ